MDEDKKPTGKRFRRMENISSVFSSSDLNHRLFGHEGFQFFLFQKRWEKLVGQVMAKESYVSSYKNDVLFVTVTNSVFLQQLYVIKNDILSRLSEDEFGKRFTDIRFISGPRKKKYQTFTTLDPINRAIEKEQRMYDQPLTDKETDWIRHWVDTHVEKEALQAPFSDMMKAVLQIRKGELAAAGLYVDVGPLPALRRTHAAGYLALQQLRTQKPSGKARPRHRAASKESAFHLSGGHEPLPLYLSAL